MTREKLGSGCWERAARGASPNGWWVEGNLLAEGVVGIERLCNGGIELVRAMGWMLRKREW